jgi:dolichol-phosphate mannosyltransferase
MDGGGGMKLSVVMPARSEEESVGQTVEGVARALDAERIDYEIVVVDDHSTDRTAAVVDRISAENSRVRCIRSSYDPGFGFAVRAGLNEYTGDAVVVMMADGSDHPQDLVRYHRELEEGWECVFGSRFIRGAKVHRYPRLKLVMNRLANWFVRVIFRHHYNDTTNAFKAYRREVIDAIKPLLSNHFNLTVEMPLKAIVRGHTFRVIPISWTNRSAGRSKLGVREMGSRYLFIVLYVWLEDHLSRGDYRRPAAELEAARLAQRLRRQSRSPESGSAATKR